MHWLFKKIRKKNSFNYAVFVYIKSRISHFIKSSATYKSDYRD